MTVLFRLEAYTFNNAYEVWTIMTALPILAILAYYFASQLMCRLPSDFHAVHLREEEISRGRNSGILSQSFQNDRTRPDRCALCSSLDPESQRSSESLDHRQYWYTPYADFQLISLLSGPSGIVNFWTDLFVHVAIPIILVSIGFLIARPKMFVQIVERA